MDWHILAVLSWRLSNAMDTDFCIVAREEAMKRYGFPEIFNMDQGSQCTSQAFTQALKDAEVSIFMDGKGRWMDNAFIERLWRLREMGAPLPARVGNRHPGPAGDWKPGPLLQ
nr:DDE-type integrase/transposase/recombinase [Desulfolutivibrio sulfodismutans]